MSEKYVIGIDFGTERARAVLVSRKGEIASSSKTKYANGLITGALGKILLPAETVLQDPADWLKALKKTVKEITKSSGVSPKNIAGIGIAFTSCTILPIAKNGVPLCHIAEFGNNPYAFAKLWKHQAAKKEATLIEEIARQRKEPFLKYYGGKINVQFALPKILETLHAAPQVYRAADRFIEAGDWIVLQLISETGTKDDERRSACFAGYKECFVKSLGGFPGKEFFIALDPCLKNLTEDKLNSQVFCLGEKAGGLTKNWAQKLGLKSGTPIAVAGIDAHLGAIGAGITENTMIIVMGTSFCHMYVSDQFKEVSGMFGIVENGILPGFFCYEAGQAAGGDILNRFVEESVGPTYYRQAKKEGLDIQSHLTNLARQYQVGETGLLALDWHAGNRSILGNSELSGLLIGEKLDTTAPQKYRALLEALCFGTYKIIKEMERNGLTIRDIVACGGVAAKNDLILQTLADVANKKVILAPAEQTVALGAAILASVATGLYPSIQEAQENMVSQGKTTFQPNAKNYEVYQKLFALYEREHDHFGQGGDKIMKELLEIRNETN